MWPERPLPLRYSLSFHHRAVVPIPKLMIIKSEVLTQGTLGGIVSEKILNSHIIFSMPKLLSVLLSMYKWIKLFKGVRKQIPQV